jgi:hypothetical protein
MLILRPAPYHPTKSIQVSGKSTPGKIRLVGHPKNQSGQHRDAKNAQSREEPDLFLMRGKASFSDVATHI